MIDDLKNDKAWWKWGFGDKSYHLSDFPKLKLFLENKWDKSIEDDLILPDYNQIINDSKFSNDDCKKIFPKLDESKYSNSKIDRLKYGFGKGYQDALYILTKKDITLPDFVLYPESENDIIHILEMSSSNNISVITFSGGTNVTECFFIEKKAKWVCALNMQRMNKVLEIDPISLTATFECGIYGPDLEKGLNKRGLTMGHFPQSFEFSTLGGWIATRSAGQESGKYGKIEDMILGLKTITPKYVLQNKDYPKHATGIDLHSIFVGSEGTLGVVVEAKMKIHKIPQHNKWITALFKDFESGTNALRSMAQMDYHPAICRLSDTSETQLLSLLDNSESKAIKQHLQKIYKSYLKKRGYGKPCILMMKFLGQNNDLIITKNVKKILYTNSAKILPSSVSANWENKRFSLPYLRETLIQHRILIDMFETSTYWKNIQPLYIHIKKSLNEKSNFFNNGGILFCHISHIYNTGASLYFTMLASQEKDNELSQWNLLKEIVTSAIYEGGGAISHHHGIGKTHKKWYNKQLNKNEKSLLKVIKSHLDPNNILNPGKLFDET